MIQGEASAKLLFDWGYSYLTRGRRVNSAPRLSGTRRQKSIAHGHIYNFVKHCACPERKISSLDCNDCFLSGACIASDYKTKIAIYILKGKEVILELV